MLNKKVYSLLQYFSDVALISSDVISWGAPVPSFGNALTSRIATLGLNPSNKEFVDNNGKELVGDQRRFHTLSSLGISAWSEASPDHVEKIVDSCIEYFKRNPYDGWFKSLDYLISGTASSYYFPSNDACHLDLIPFATLTKWAELKESQKQVLIALSAKSLGYLLQSSEIEIVILNGRAVVDTFRNLSDVDFDVEEMSEWVLPRRGCKGVKGYAYRGFFTKIASVDIGRRILVLGYNHNIQSSYGVTTAVKTSIRNWITQSSNQCP